MMMVCMERRNGEEGRVAALGVSPPRELWLDLLSVLVPRVVSGCYPCCLSSESPLLTRGGQPRHDLASDGST